MQSTTFGTPNARTPLYSLPETPIPLKLPSPLPNIPQNSLQTSASADLLFHPDQHNRVYNSEEAPRSFTMAPCVVVERLEGKQRCSRAPVGEHAGARARTCTMWLFTRNERSAKSNQTPQQPITPSRQRAAQSTPAPLHWCGAYSLGPSPTQAARCRGHPQNHFCHFRAFSITRQPPFIPIPFFSSSNGPTTDLKSCSCVVCLFVTHSRFSPHAL